MSRGAKRSRVLLQKRGAPCRLPTFSSRMHLPRHLWLPAAAVAIFSVSFFMPLRAADSVPKQKKSTGAPAAAPSADAKSATAKTTPTPYPLILGPIRLWEDDAPGARGNRPQDIPTLTPYPADPAKKTGATMLIFPGGGYGNLAEHEGTGYAEFFAQHGITAYVLKYRLGSNGYRHPVMLNDAARALRMVRAFANRDGLDPARVGVIGSSAGGHLAATLATHFDSKRADGPKLEAGDAFDRESSRPDLAILCYPVISFGEFAHAGSRRALLGENPPADLVQNLSNELQVTKDTPPCFLWHTVEDKTVPVENSLLFASALRRAGVPFSLHIYENGPHGLGLGRPGREAPPWAEQLLYWFKERKFVR
jgi:acetyl esterase/lipase